MQVPIIPFIKKYSFLLLVYYVVQHLMYFFWKPFIHYEIVEQIEATRFQDGMISLLEYIPTFLLSILIIVSMYRDMSKLNTRLVAILALALVYPGVAVCLFIISILYNELTKSSSSNS